MTVGIRDLSRNLNILNDYDYLDVEDKKTHEYKGLFISPKYADEFKKYLKDKISKLHAEKLLRVSKYAGKGTIIEKYNDLNSSEIRKQISEEKNAK